jgi:RND family efflux transporter MFP subunit
MDAMKTLAILLSLLVLAACGASGGNDAGDKPDPVALVRTAAATLGTASAQTIVYGTAEAGPGGSRTLVAPAEAIVDRILAPTGTPVKAGQIILTLKPSRTSATDIAKASADATSASAAYQRAVRLRADDLVSDGDVELAKAAAQTARATLSNLGMSAGGAVLKAPMAGVIQGLSVKSGDQVAAGTAVASVVSNGNLRAHLGIDPAIAQHVRPGQSLTLGSLSGDAAAATVAVTGVDTQVDPATRLAAVYAQLPRGFHAGPGEALRGSLSLTAQATGVTIPYVALLDDGGRSYVFVVKGGVAHEQDVSPGNSAGDHIQILKGLAVGDRVVTEGGTALEDGINVVEQGVAR